MHNIRDLSDEEQIWLTKAVSNIIIADGEVAESEVIFLKKLSKVIPEESARKTLAQVAMRIGYHSGDDLNEIKVDHLDNLIFMLDILAASVFANGKKLKEETTMFFEAGKKLGVNIGTLSYRLSIEAEKYRVMRNLEKIRKSIKTDPIHTLVQRS